MQKRVQKSIPKVASKKQLTHRTLQTNNSTKSLLVCSSATDTQQNCLISPKISQGKTTSFKKPAKASQQQPPLIVKILESASYRAQKAQNLELHKELLEKHILKLEV